MSTWTPGAQYHCVLMCLQMQKYTRIRKIGRGTRGECSLVLNAEDQQLYVAKEVHLDSLSEVERMAALNEVDLMSTLDHPNIIKYVESFVQKKCGTPTKLCIVMEYAEGGDLGKCAKAADGEELSEEDILDRFIEICFAVDYCHQQNIMHHDLKLENVFLTSSGHIKLGDFGMSQNLDGPTEIMEDLVGTPYYFSPEIINGLPCGTKSDVWSLGVLLYKLMAHRYPFKGRGLPELLVRIAKGRYEALPDHFSAELRGLVDSLLTADCDARLSASDILRLPLIQRRLGRWEETAASDDGYVRRLKDTHGPSVWQATSKKRPSTVPEQEVRDGGACEDCSQSCDGGERSVGVGRTAPLQLATPNRLTGRCRLITFPIRSGSHAEDHALGRGVELRPRARPDSDRRRQSLADVHWQKEAAACAQKPQ